MQTDNLLELDPIFSGMTKPQIVMGVPMEFFGINFILFGIGMIAIYSLTGKLIFVVAVCVPLHAMAYLATEREAHWMSILLTKLSRCGPIRNRSFWKSNSYSP